MSSTRRILTLSAALACSNTSGTHLPPSQEAAPPIQSPLATEPPPAPATQPAPWTEPPRVSLALLAHEATQERGQVVSVVLGADGPRVLEPFTVPTIPEAVRFHRVVAAHDGADAFAMARVDRASGGWYVDVRDLGERRTWRSLAIPHAVPAALHLVAGRLLIGHAERLSTFALAAPTTTISELRHREEMRGKAYDLVARHHQHVIAIDDVATPIYADSFDLAGATPSHRHGFALPSVANGHYDHAVLRVDPGFNGRLFAITSFAVMTGSGHDLMAIPITQGAPTTIAGGPDGVVILHEMVSRELDAQATLLAGDAATPWTGLACVELATGGLVLIAAGTRGLLSVPADFASTSPVTSHDLGGAITDVFAHDNRAWVLRRRGERGSTLLELDLATPGTIGLGAPVELDGAYQRFIR